jgi:hypothetical protein
MFPIGDIANEYISMSNSELQLEISPINIGELEKDAQLIRKNLSEDNLSKLTEYVLDNLSNLDGGPSINRLEVLNFKYDREEHTGSFRLKFQIDRRYCCSDTESCVNDYLDFDFKVHQDNLIAKTEYFDWSLNN